ncbi:MAG: T9SS type A sorting domain-containing protein [Candidatus Cyclobacteriaceae bacterium M2_1C_046]
MKKIIFFIALYIGGLSLLISSKTEDKTENKIFLTGQEIWQEQLAKKKKRRDNGYAKMDAPDVFQEFHKEIRTPEDLKSPEYSLNYRFKALKEAKKETFNARTAASGVLEFKSRGPANVPGRTRGLLVMQTDPTFNTWLAGAAGGGIWKTTDAGRNWVNLTPDFPVLAVSTLANSDANPNIIYAGTGEYVASAGTAIEGAGIFKSTDGGNTWIQLPSTVSTNEFISVTRVIVDPQNPDLVLACSAPNVWDAPGEFLSTIMRSEDGGATWTRVYEVLVEDIQGGTSGTIEQLIATPGNFDILYASAHRFGVLKSTDAGQTWFPAKQGMDPFGRIEIAVSPTNPNRLFASAQGSLAGSESDLYVSDDAAGSWNLVNSVFENTPLDFLGGQGWYDNTIAIDPYDEDIVYYGGVSLFRTLLGTEVSIVNNYNLNNTATFINLTNFRAEYAGGLIDAGIAADTISVEVRFGPGMAQNAHRFLVPEDATTGVPGENYFYQDYVEVPFEVWDITNNRQLMVAFRDQGRDGKFNLIEANTDGPATEQSREYLYISNFDYNPNSPHPDMAENAGHEAANMFFFWPVLASGATWDPNNLPESALQILFNGVEKIDAETQPVSDVYGEYTGINQFQTQGEDVHPDQHNMIMIPVKPSLKEYRILLSNDGGVFYSNVAAQPGINEGDWTFAGMGYITSQFYGADKSPIEERYLGGMQDNGTWFSPDNTSADESTRYRFAIGGDGFEVIWHNLDANKLIGGSQYNNFRRSLDGGFTWTNATTGITGDEPFISKLSNSKYLPEVIYTVTSDGVFRSEDFGGQWELTLITNEWIGNSSPTYLDVEVSRANANIIWAGSAMTSTRKLHVSTDGGKSFKAVNNYALRTMGTISRLASHPTEDSTAYALFSFAKRPKILRTTDLGETWEDISGYEGAEISSNNFPNVAVYSLYVRPDNTDIIWAGTEVGIFESIDNGQSWHKLNEFISASVWDMKGRGNEIVIATHGRGIWTATTDQVQQSFNAPTVAEIARTPDGKIAVALTYETNIDSAQLFINDQFIGSIQTDANPQDTIILSGVDVNEFSFQVIGYKGNAPLANRVMGSVIPAADPKESFFTQFTDRENIAIGDFRYRTFSFSSMDFSLQSPHPYPNNSDLTFKIISPIVVSAENSAISYEDIAIVEPGAGNDFVVVEATLDGLNWIPLIDPYDAGFSTEWQALYNSNTTPDHEDFIRHDIDLTNFFNPGEKILIRFRLHSDAAQNGWGWAVDNLFIQTEVVNVVENLEDEISIFPNPANDHINVELPFAYGKATILDISGRQIMEKPITGKNLKLNTSRIKNGAYVLVLEQDGRKVVKKFIVEH